MDPRMQQNRKAFFSEQNESMLYGMLAKNFQQRLGSQLNEKQASHLERGVEFYMSEVFQANSSAPVQSLNKEVISATAADFNEYLQRQEAASTASPQMFQDASNRFDQMQQDRQRGLEAPRPAIPDYVKPMALKEDDSISALSLFEEAKKRRNLEMNAQAEVQMAKRTASAGQPIYSEPEDRPDPRSLYDKPLDLVIAGQDRELSGRGDVNSTLARADSIVAPRGSLPQDMLIKQDDIQSYKESEYNLSVYSADRKWEVNTNLGENRFNFSVNLYSGNPTNGLSIMPKGASRLRNIVRIEFVKAVIPIEVTEMLVRKVYNSKKDDIITKLIFANALATQGAGLQGTTASINNNDLFSAYQNIMGSSTPNGNIKAATVSYDTQYLKNIFAYPFVTLNVSELDTNTYGTNNSMDNAFGILQYDSNWTDNTDSLGFTSLIPKHMKCQRIYSPTPLATLNKLSIRLQQPNGSLVNSTPDTLDISGIFLSKSVNIRTYFSNMVDISGTAYLDEVGEYIFIDSKKWFNRYQFSVGDRIQIRNLESTIVSPAMLDFLNFIQRSDGHSIIGTAYTNELTSTLVDAVGGLIYGTDTFNATNFKPTAGVAGGNEVYRNLVDGNNTAGYSRFIIIRGQFSDPTTGKTTVSPFGGAVDNSTLGNATNTISKGRLINLSRQTQFIFRIITREYDSSSLVRPDNL
jgi:hypothetical protein